MKGSLTLVVPLFMEADRFARTAEDLVAFVESQPHGSELIFVDDGSADGTRELAERFLAAHSGVRVRLLRRPHRGKGAAVRAGLEAACGALAGFCDLDLSTPVADLAALVEAARAAPILAIGSRDLVGSRLLRHEGPVREFLGRAYNRAVQFTLLPGVVDTQCGAKVARNELWRRLLPLSQEDGFAWDVEIISLARAMAIAVKEFPVAWSHDPRSRVRVVRDGARMLLAIPRIHRRLTRTISARAGSGTPSGVFEGANATALAAADATHWWFRSKAAFVDFALRRFQAQPGWLVDVGAGSAGVTALLGWAPGRTLVVEGSTELVRTAVCRHALRATQADITSLPLANGCAAVVCLLDVLEHLADPAPALAEARRLLAPQGRLVITVPAHPRLWSAADEALGHVRRYIRGDLRAEVEAQGLRVLWLSHFFSWLLAPVWYKRRMRPGGGPELGLDVSFPAVDRIALLMTRLERAVIARIQLPAGTSILCVAERC